jgi:hypothetical protein
LSAARTRQPLLSYAILIVMGFAPLALVIRFYGVLPNRIVVRWDTFGNMTVIGTRPGAVLMIANVAALIALTAVAIAVWQQRALVSLGMRRAYLGLNLAQIVAINLVCAMIVSDALGLGLAIKPMVPPAMAVLLFAAGILCLRIDQSRRSGWARAFAVALLIAGPAFLIYSAIGSNVPLGYYASAFAAVAMAALALPSGKA